MTKFFRIIKFAFQNLGRNLWLTIMTVVILTVTVFSVNILLSLNVLAQAVAQSLEKRIDVSVYVKPEAKDEEESALRSHLASLPQVAEVRTVSPEEAMAIFRARHKDDPEIIRALDEVGENPLGATYIVRAKSLDHYPAIITALDHPAYRDLVAEKDFEDYTALIGRVRDMQSKISQVGMAMLSLFAVLAMIIMVNVVRVAIFTHKEEIAIMKLVGASGMFIRGPYMVESALLSFAALLLATGALAAGIYFGSPYLNSFLGVDPALASFFTANAAVIALSEFGALAVLTGLASAYAVGRYMKV